MGWTSLRAVVSRTTGQVASRVIWAGRSARNQFTRFFETRVGSNANGGQAEAPTWKLPETSMKPYPCCRHTHPAIDAALELRDRLDGELPRTIRIGSYPAALDVTDRPHPTTPHQARFSIQYTVATSLLRGRPGLDAFEPDAVQDPALEGLLACSSVESSPTLAEAYPTRRGAAVEAETGAGDLLRVERASATGDPECPLDDGALDAKVSGLFAWAGLDARGGRELLGGCRGLVDDGEVFGLPG